MCVTAISCKCDDLQGGRDQPISHFCRPAPALCGYSGGLATEFRLTDGAACPRHLHLFLMALLSATGALNVDIRICGE